MDACHGLASLVRPVLQLTLPTGSAFYVREAGSWIAK